jgi:sec-independent protein translocase protein TatA
VGKRQEPKEEKNMLFKQLGPLELIIILVIVVLIFGVGRLGRLGKDLGEGIREFRKGLSGGEGKDKAEVDEGEDEAA